ncbi:MAG: aspartate carbamoyltransferase catalytic subunit [Symbiobacteriaceae bacterium]|nr:aspartate carbamoyltransferase catalytic subunit [Symbiobacteriaceae bacterium]
MDIILATARSMKELVQSPVKKESSLKGKVVINLFYEPSTRTRSSFELAGKYLGGDVINITTATSSVVKGESLLDTARTILMMGCDVLVVRHSSSGSPHFLAQHLSCSVINAGDGMHEHPTQGLLDLFTIRDQLGSVAGKRVVILGDVAHSRVARSNIWALTKFGAKVTVCGPKTLIPVEVRSLGVEVSYDADTALAEADVINVLRLQLERQHKGLFPSIREYHAGWGLNQRRLNLAKPGALVLHPGPMNRGVEISSDIADGDQSLIEEQVTNGVAIRMALLHLLVGEVARDE